MHQASELKLCESQNLLGGAHQIDRLTVTYKFLANTNRCQMLDDNALQQRKLVEFKEMDSKIIALAVVCLIYCNLA